MSVLGISDEILTTIDNDNKNDDRNKSPANANGDIWEKTEDGRVVSREPGAGSRPDTHDAPSGPYVQRYWGLFKYKERVKYADMIPR